MDQNVAVSTYAAVPLTLVFPASLPKTYSHRGGSFKDTIKVRLSSATGPKANSRSRSLCFPSLADFSYAAQRQRLVRSKTSISKGRQKKRREDNIGEWTGLEFGRSQRAAENRERWRKLFVKSPVVPQRLSRLRDRSERWWDQNLIFGVSLIKREDPPTQLSRTWPSCYTLVWHPHAEFRREGSFLRSVWHPHAECRREDSALGSKIRLTPQSFRFDQDVALCWLVECTMIRPACGTVLTGGMHEDLTSVWHCVDWWNAQGSDQRVALCWLVECTMIWPACGTVLTGGMHDDLTSMWHCADWWNTRWSDQHVALCWLVGCTMIWPACGTVLTGRIWPACGTVLTGGMHDDPSLIPALKWMYFASRHLVAGDISRVVYVFGINQPSLPTPSYSVLVSVSVFMALSTVFNSINSPDVCFFFSSFFFCLRVLYDIFDRELKFDKKTRGTMTCGINN